MTPETGNRKPKTGNSSPRVSPARAAAFDILLRVERESSYASELLHSSAYKRLSALDHALATELVMGILRWRSLLDETIAQASSQPLPKLDLEILLALRIALYQLRYLDRIPARAAIHESVELVKRSRKRSAASFVNAVLRKLPTTPAIGESSAAGEASFSAKNIAHNNAHPPWLVERWAQAYGLAAAQQICRYNQSVPTTAIRLRDPQVEIELAAEGIQLAPGALLSSARRINAGDITETPSFRSGRIVIQDEASQVVAALVGHGSRILDCCAAPGGKTRFIADRNPNAKITAVEIHPHRARLLQNMLRPANHASGPDRAQGTEVLIADARALPTNSFFDRVLADVPCSGTGTLARNPEIKWRLQPADLADLHARQLAILQSAMNQVAPGGRLIYSTCSLEKEENEDVVDQALAGNSSFRVLDCRNELTRLRQEGELIWPDPEALISGPYLRTLPGKQPCEGFFAALLERS